MKKQRKSQPQNARDLPRLQAHFKALHPDLNLDDKISANWVGFEKEKQTKIIENIMCAGILASTAGVFLGAVTNNITLAIVPCVTSVLTSVAAYIGNIGGQERIYEKTLARTSVQVAEMKAASAETCAPFDKTTAPHQPAQAPANKPADCNPYTKG